MKKSKVDFHILTHPSQDRQKLLADTIDSFGCRESVNVYILGGVDRHIGKGRFQGFQKGSADYVSFVDDDDMVIHSGIDACISYLDNNEHIDAVVTREYISEKDGSGITDQQQFLRPKDYSTYTIDSCRQIHHLVMLRRSSVEPYLDVLNECPDLAEFTLWAEMINDGRKFVQLPDYGYIWIQHKDNARSLKLPLSDKARATLEMITKRKSDD